MPLLSFFRFILSLMSWALVVVVIYLAWSWYEGEWYRDVYGVLHQVRHDWRLWTAVGLAVWSFGGGGLIVKPLLAKPDRSPFTPKRSHGQMIEGADGSNLYLEGHGPGGAPCKVLTHGWGLDSTIWEYAKRDLSGAFRVVCWDLPGMGKSKAGHRGITLESFAADLKHVIEWTGAQKAVLVGRSIGGMTAQTLVRDHTQFVTDRVAGIVLVNTSYKNPLTTMIMNGLATALQKPLSSPCFI